MSELNRFSPNGLLAVLFDLDGTIRHSKPRGVDIFHRLAEEHGVNFTDEQVKDAERWQHAYWAQSDDLRADIADNGGSQEGDFWRQHARRHLRVLGAAEEDIEELAALLTEKMSGDYQPENYIPEDVIPSLALLKEQGYKLGVVSNRSESFVQLIEDLSLTDYFDISLAAGEVGLWKPDPRLLLHALSLLEITPDAAVYVGDNFYADVVAARAAGIQPILIDTLDLYPSVDCPIIRSLSEVPGLLGNKHIE
ncbi:MAG: HAD-IA family hydrolase [Anaerolineales bacterium]|nr:HAD-IA family hydrolase [Anaerolineales bacterium]